MDKMSVVMLCAGRGTRMLPLTTTHPKPLQMVGSKNLIEWKLEALPEEVVDIILVIGYQGEQIQKYFGDEWMGRRIRYVIQKELNGTAGALLAAKSILNERFLVMMGDDLYDKRDIATLMMHDFAVCVFEVQNKVIKGEILINKEGNFAGIVEEKHFVKHGYINTGLYALPKAVLDIPPVLIDASSREFGLPQTIAVIAKHTNVQLLKAHRWMQITTPEDLRSAEIFVTSMLTRNVV